MNDFTKDELEEIKRCLTYMVKGGVTPYSTFTIDVKIKVQKMIDKHSSLNNKKIAAAHLFEASSLIDHARCLLGLDEHE